MGFRSEQDPVRSSGHHSDLDEDSQNCPIWRLLRNSTGFRRPRSLAAGPPKPPLPPRSRYAARSPSRRPCTSPNTSTWAPIRLFHPKLPHPAPIHCLGRGPSPLSGTKGRLPGCLLQRRPPRGIARPNGAPRSCPCRVTAPPHPLCCYRAISHLHPPPRPYCPLRWPCPSRCLTSPFR